MRLFIAETEPKDGRPDRTSVDRFVNDAHFYDYASECLVQRDADGKPSLLSRAGEPLARYCSISHTRNWLACAFVEHAAVGVDIEIAKPRDYIATGGWFFGADVGALLARAAPESQRRRLFYHAWTAYEALYKCGVNRRRSMLPLLQGDAGDTAAGITLRWVLGPRDLLACVAVLNDTTAHAGTITVLRTQGDSFAIDGRWRPAVPW